MEHAKRIVTVTSAGGGIAVARKWENFGLDADGGLAWTRQGPASYLDAAGGRFRRIGASGRRLGFGYLRDAEQSTFFYTSLTSAVYLPYWPIAATAATPPLLWLGGRARLRGRRRRG